MLSADSCHVLPFVCLLDYSYLALNVYHSNQHKQLLGKRPVLISSLEEINTIIDSQQQGWFQLTDANNSQSIHHNFYAELYAKIYQKKIQHIMIAIRGTMINNLSNVYEDVSTWWKDILSSTATIYKKPSYWPLVNQFLSWGHNLIQTLKHHRLLASQCDYHATGHSLGGALVNLLSGYADLLLSPQLYIISFNPPGIGNMENVTHASYFENQVITMRAEYDWVSSLGQPYGIVINNEIKEQSLIAQSALKKIPLNFDTLFNVELDFIEMLTNPGLLLEKKLKISINEAKALVAQHSMKHFLWAILNSQNAYMTFTQLNHWGTKHKQGSLQNKASILI
jgi:hypothetical protein